MHDTNVHLRGRTYNLLHKIFLIHVCMYDICTFVGTYSLSLSTSDLHHTVYIWKGVRVPWDV
jgi:hypothetical protein